VAGGSKRQLGVALALLPGALLVLLVICAISVALVFAPAGGGCEGEAPTNLKGVPARLAPIYQRAALKYELGPQGPSILAAINKIETGFGVNQGPSSAGAVGWMQFMPATWDAYGVDANGDGVADPADPEDAIFAAARYLRASGMPGDVEGAIFAYNHADWYVADVLREAERFAAVVDGVAPATVGACVAAPPGGAVARMVAEAERLSRLRPRSAYVYGGSHGISPTPANGPFDCSSAVSHLLQVAGLGNPTMTTVDLRGWGKPGPGRWVTIFNKPYGEDAHTFIRFAPGVTPANKRFWGTSGLGGFDGHGPGWIPESLFGADYLAGFELRHPKDL
jgi:transglycosylase-like protein with SLT domain